MQTKVGIIIPVTLLMGVGFTLMYLKAVYIPCVILVVVWVCHIIYFVFGVKTIPAAGKKNQTRILSFGIIRNTL